MALVVSSCDERMEETHRNVIKSVGLAVVSVGFEIYAVGFLYMSVDISSIRSRGWDGTYRLKHIENTQRTVQIRNIFALQPLKVG